jgi:uncharacterized protein (TIGR03437 family)
VLEDSHLDYFCQKLMAAAGRSGRSVPPIPPAAVKEFNMKFSKSKVLLMPLALAAAATLVFTSANPTRVWAQSIRFTGPMSSQPLALSADDSLLLVANPDNNTVTLFDVKNGNARLVEIPVGKEPNGVALSPDGSRGYVANTVDGTVSVIGIDRSRYNGSAVSATIRVGTEPYGIAITPGGTKLYVANARSNSVSVISTASNSVTANINTGPEPRGIAITNSGVSDTQETVFVTQFLSLPIAGKVDGADDAKAGHVTVISAASDTALGDVTINPIADTGFKAAGDALQRIAPPATPQPADFKFVTGAYPNQLNNIAVRGKFAFVPNTGASPNGPFRFNVNTQSLLSVIDTTTRRDAGKTINMHSAVDAQTGTPKRFITQPWAIAFKHQADEAFVVSAASNIVVKLKIDPNTGAATVQTDPTDLTRVLEIPTGKNPRGIVINSSDQKAYVMNYVSRDVSVIDLGVSVETVSATLPSVSLPLPGTPEDKVQTGKELYYTSVGVFDPATPGGAPITGRMSNNGWGACSACHPFGLSDNVVWIFPSGPKRTIPQHTDFDQSDPARRTLRALNWSGERDEEADFELNIRAVSGGQGLIVNADGVTPDPNVVNLTPAASTGRNQLKVRGFPAWDAIQSYVATGIRSPISPARGSADADIAAGRQLFIQANCQNCHGGSQWTSGRVRFTPPPDPSLIVNGQLIAELRSVGTFDPAAFNEVRQNGAPAIGADGFVPPSLLSLFAFPQTFFHGGAAASLDEVLQNVTHRSAGTGGVDTLASDADRSKLIKFLLAIDAATPPISPAATAPLTITSAASNIGSKLAADSLASAYGSGLALQATSPTGATFPVSLAGTTVSILDAAGTLRLAPLFFAGPGQVNFAIPPATAKGTSAVTIASANGATAAGSIEIAAVAPSVSTMPGGTAAAALGIRAAGGSQSPVAVFACSDTGTCSPLPIDLGGPSDVVVLEFFGTGLRNNSGLANVHASIGGIDSPVVFAGAQTQFAGLDQINVQLPTALRGRGTVPVQFTVDGQQSNTVQISIQ